MFAYSHRRRLTKAVQGVVLPPWGWFMISSIKVMTIAVVGLFVASTVNAAPCNRLLDISVEVKVRETPITMIGDITLADLRAMSAQLQRPARHAVLGFYAGTVGYAVRSIEVLDAQSSNGPACPAFRLEADLVAVDRRIAIAQDLAGSPCRLRAAVEHYRRHAAAASLALHRFASELPAQLVPEIQQYMRSHPGPSQELRQHVDMLLKNAVDRFTASVAQVQQEVDTESEIHRLSAPCSET